MPGREHTFLILFFFLACLVISALVGCSYQERCGQACGANLVERVTETECICRSVGVQTLPEPSQPAPASTPKILLPSEALPPLTFGAPK